MPRLPAKQPKRALRKRSPCPVACALDLLGDKWTLLIVRDLLLGKRTYKEFLQSPEHIPTNILANRLKRLEADGIVQKTPYQERPVRFAYRLTRKGQELTPILREVARWGSQHIAGTLNRRQLAALRSQLENEADES